jgi:acetylornithine/LysW-gamma-L-lysine aminotransferase
MEAALKIARAHTGRTGFVGALRAFHGRTMGALSLTAESYYREAFEPLPGPVTRVRWNDASALEAAVDTRVAAVVLEPVQGEGGVYPADPTFLAAARAACDATGALLIFDEVQTGFGRTGRLFAFEHSGVVPDVLCLAKSIAGGLPLGATVVRRGIDLAVGLHGSTFGGNPIACAVADATLRVMVEEDLPARAETLGHGIAERVRAAAPAAVREVRQIGLMIGIQTRTAARPYVDALAERGVLALVAGSKVLRLLPPLVLRDEDAEAVGTALVEVLAEG